MSDLPPGLDDFGGRLREAAEGRRRQQRPSLVGSWIRKLALPVTATALTVAVGAGAIGLVDSQTGTPIDARPEDGGGLQAAADPTVVASSAVADPSGGPPWVLRAYTNAAGEECVQVGRLQGGVFGQIQRGQFRALPPDAPGVCGPAERRRSLVAIERRFELGRTVVFGLAATREPVSITLGTASRRSRPAALGAFLEVFTTTKGLIEIRAADEPVARFR